MYDDYDQVTWNLHAWSVQLIKKINVKIAIFSFISEQFLLARPMMLNNTNIDM